MGVARSTRNPTRGDSPFLNSLPFSPPSRPLRCYRLLVERFYLRAVEYYQCEKNGHGRCSDRYHCYQRRVWDDIQWKQSNFDRVMM